MTGWWGELGQPAPTVAIPIDGVPDMDLTDLVLETEVEFSEDLEVY